MIDRDKLNEIVKDDVIDIRAYRMARVHIIKGELIVGSLGFSKVNIPFMWIFEYSDHLTEDNLRSLDRLEVTSRILEELE